MSRAERTTHCQPVNLESLVRRTKNRFGVLDNRIDAMDRAHA